VDTAGPWRKRTTKECLENQTGERNIDAMRIHEEAEWRK